MHFGVDYYPEHWPEERWSKDVKLMKEANFTVVRLAEFAWTKMEPSENHYDFSWLDTIIDMLGQANIKTILCTPTATPPKWLMDKHPEIYQEDEYNNIRGYGSRRHYCFNSSIYQDYTKKIVSKMAKRYHDNPYVITWQLDNEFGCHNTVKCYCDDCHKEFISYLENKYESIEQLNSELGMDFWSQTYYSFDSLIIPKHTACDYKQGDMYAHNPGLWLEYCRFSSQSVDNYAKLQIDTLKSNGVKVPITHNFMSRFYDIDYYKHAKLYDFITWDCYPNIIHGPFDSIEEVSYHHDKMRGYKNQPFWIMEMCSAQGGWNFMGRTPNPAQIRLWDYQAVAHGANGIVHFRWRTCLFGTEQYWHGVLDHDGVPRDRYKIIKKTCQEFMELEDIIDNTEVLSEVCIVRSFDNVWAHDYQWHSPSFDYNQILSSIHVALTNMHINCDVVDLSVDLNKYKLIILPAYNITNESEVKKIQEYVKNGGCVVLTFRSGNRDEYNKINGLTLPGYFREMAGIDVINYDALGQEQIKIKGITGDTTATLWADIIDPKESEVLASYDSEFYKNTPCITKNIFGEGSVYYVGCHVTTPIYEKILKTVISDLSIIQHVVTPVDGVETIYRRSDNQEATFVLNHNDFPITITLSKPKNIKIHLEAYDVTVVY
ncbi:MAG: beta-galactosidase [Clostridiales bacterium]|nr:beta-galactosidase [Clostridiales bacterium]